jgi:hypothetical protein
MESVDAVMVWIQIFFLIYEKFARKCTNLSCFVVGYWGKICQFKDECGTDNQCGGSSRYVAIIFSKIVIKI